MKETDLNRLKEKIQIIPLLDTIRLLDISDEEYFSATYAHCISNSRLSLINPDQGGSPEKYINGFQSSSNSSDSLYFGSAVHELILQPESFEVIKNIKRPTAKLGFVIDEIIKNRQKGLSIYQSIINASNKIDYYKNKLDDKKIHNIIQNCLKYYLDVTHYVKTDKDPIFLSERDNIRIEQCLSSLKNNRNIVNLLQPFYISIPPVICNEGTLLMDVKAIINNKEYIYTLKAKLDNFIIDFEAKTIYLNDLKTTGHILKEFPISFNSYHYYRQMSMYYWMLLIYIKKTYPDINEWKGRANMIVVSTIPEYNSGIYKVNNDQIKMGFDEFSYLLRLVVELIDEVYVIQDNQTI